MSDAAQAPPPPDKESAARPPTTLAECIGRLAETTAVLRGPEGCPWDRAQTHQSLRSALIEECYEVIEAIDSGDPAHLREELGDLLLHVLLHSRIAREAGDFTLAEVMRGLHGKLISRHPHVFGDSRADDPEAVIRVWEEAKRAEKTERTSAMDGIPPGMPSLLRAEKAAKKAERAGHPWQAARGTLDQIRADTRRIQEAMDRRDDQAAAEGIGDLLFNTANLARQLDGEAELLLHQATDAFIRRFRAREADATRPDAD